MEKNINNRRMVLLLLFYSCKQAGCTWVQPTVQSYNVVQSQLAEHNWPGAWWAAQTDLVSAGECLNPNPPSKVKQQENSAQIRLGPLGAIPKQ